MKSTLKVYVTEHCPGCVEARNTAIQIELDYPDITVQLIDIASAGDIIPQEIFATPTYMLDNQVMSLGNPGPDDIARWMSMSRVR